MFVQFLQYIRIYKNLKINLNIFDNPLICLFFCYECDLDADILLYFYIQRNTTFKKLF